MAYSNFTLDKVIETFELDIVDSEELFGEVEPMKLNRWYWDTISTRRWSERCN